MSSPREMAKDRLLKEAIRSAKNPETRILVTDPGLVYASKLSAPHVETQVTRKDKKCRRCGYAIAEGTRHEPFSTTWADREAKKFRAWACDIYNGQQLMGSCFGKRYTGAYRK